MGTIANDIFRPWQEEGRCLIQENSQVFSDLVAQAQNFSQCGKYGMAAVYADLAAFYATYMQHCGLFASPDLERILLTIGTKAIKTSYGFGKNYSFDGTVKNVLHIVYGVWSIGGHSRLLWRWIQQDKERFHSVVLTQQSLEDVPKLLKDTVLNSHGQIYALDKTIGSHISKAKRLREIATSADVVVLHTIDDIIPIIAFADKEKCPPVIFVNHADERFWLGVGISDIVANLRESGLKLSRERRGIEVERNMLLPTLVEPVDRLLSRADAKQQLGISQDSVVLLSIARALKYKTIDGINFAYAHVSLLKQYKQAILIVIGPGNKEDWSAAIQQTQGRIKVFSEREDTAVFYQAADIYVDSFPFMSITSLLEAGSYGVPLVSRYPYSDACQILGADMPGLTGNLIRVHDIDEYKQVLSQLIEDEEFRLCLGSTTKKQIVDIHTGSNWQQFLQDIYLQATTVPRVTLKSAARDQIFLGEPDVYLQRIFYDAPSKKYIKIDEMVKNRARFMPFFERLRLWIKLLKMGDFGRMARISILLPHWLYSRLLKLISLSH
ncbi:glycosyltransferase [Calothrix membranacea FACHB-236]|nr:glycosyltransferase [Calothrix membranacea FACHB-236]